MASVSRILSVPKAVNYETEEKAKTVVDNTDSCTEGKETPAQRKLRYQLSFILMSFIFNIKLKINL